MRLEWKLDLWNRDVRTKIMFSSPYPRSSLIWIFSQNATIFFPRKIYFHRTSLTPTIFQSQSPLIAFPFTLYTIENIQPRRIVYIYGCINKHRPKNIPTSRYTPAKTYTACVWVNQNSTIWHELERTDENITYVHGYVRSINSPGPNETIGAFSIRIIIIGAYVPHKSAQTKIFPSARFRCFANIQLKIISKHD